MKVGLLIKYSLPGPELDIESEPIPKKKTKDHATEFRSGLKGFRFCRFPVSSQITRHILFFSLSLYHPDWLIDPDTTLSPPIPLISEKKSGSQKFTIKKYKMRMLSAGRGLIFLH